MYRFNIYELETKYGIIDQLYARNQFTVCKKKKKLVSLNKVLFDQVIYLRQVIN